MNATEVYVPHSIPAHGPFARTTHPYPLSMSGDGTPLLVRRERLVPIPAPWRNWFQEESDAYDAMVRLHYSPPGQTETQWASYSLDGTIVTDVVGRGVRPTLPHDDTRIVPAESSVDWTDIPPARFAGSLVTAADIRRARPKVSRQPGLNPLPADAKAELLRKAVEALSPRLDRVEIGGRWVERWIIPAPVVKAATKDGHETCEHEVWDAAVTGALYGQNAADRDRGNGRYAAARERPLAVRGFCRMVMESIPADDGLVWISPRGTAVTLSPQTAVRMARRIYDQYVGQSRKRARTQSEALEMACNALTPDKEAMVREASRRIDAGGILEALREEYTAPKSRGRKGACRKVLEVLDGVELRTRPAKLAPGRARMAGEQQTAMATAGNAALRAIPLN